MNIALEHKNPTEALIKVTLNKSDYQPDVEKKIREYSKKVQMKGFRPGKVPPSLIKKMYGREMLIEGVQSKLQKELSEFLKKEDIRFLGGPLPDYKASSKLDEELEDELIFVYRLGLIPAFALPEEDLGVEFFEILVTEEKFEEYLATQLQEYDISTEVDQAELGDFVEGVLHPQESTEPSPEEIETPVWKANFPINNLVLPLRQVSEAQQSLFLGAKAGDTLVFSLYDIFDEPEDQIRYLTGLDREVIAQLKGNFVLEVQKITRLLPAPKSLELLQEIYPHVRAETEEEFKQKIKEDFAKGQQQLIDSMRNDFFKEVLLKKINLELPHEFLKEWIAMSRQDNASPEEIEQSYQEEQAELVWTVIVNQIKRQQNITVSEQEVFEEAYRFLLRYTEVDTRTEEGLRTMSGLTHNFLSMNEGKQHQLIVDRLTENKAFSYLKEFYRERAASVRTVSLEEFFQILREEGETEARLEDGTEAKEWTSLDEHPEINPDSE
ncbi:MAG: hypothetical protein HC913_11980 [Microscillaceae bacterium]|nr:hypothetical protein [Microscillaceae bacterium]